MTPEQEKVVEKVHAAANSEMARKWNTVHLSGQELVELSLLLKELLPNKESS